MNITILLLLLATIGNPVTARECYIYQDSQVGS